MKTLYDVLLERLDINDLREVIANHPKRKEILVKISHTATVKFDHETVGSMLVFKEMPDTSWKRVLLDVLLSFETENSLNTLTKKAVKEGKKTATATVEQDSCGRGGTMGGSRPCS
jgi:hypothetical protein